jgi:hypothetical protein
MNKKFRIANKVWSLRLGVLLRSNTQAVGELVGGWRVLFNEELYTFLLLAKYCKDNQIKEEEEMAERVARHEETRNSYKFSPKTRGEKTVSGKAGVD